MGVINGDNKNLIDKIKKLIIDDYNINNINSDHHKWRFKYNNTIHSININYTSDLKIYRIVKRKIQGAKKYYYDLGGVDTLEINIIEERMIYYKIKKELSEITANYNLNDYIDFSRISINKYNYNALHNAIKEDGDNDYITQNNINLFNLIKDGFDVRGFFRDINNKCFIELLNYKGIFYYMHIGDGSFSSSFKNYSLFNQLLYDLEDNFFLTTYYSEMLEII
jgi:hypothetical protein